MLFSTKKCGLTKQISLVRVVKTFSCMTRKNIMDVQPGAPVLITIASFCCSDINHRREQEVGSFANAPRTDIQH